MFLKKKSKDFTAPHPEPSFPPMEPIPSSDPAETILDLYQHSVSAAPRPEKTKEESLQEFYHAIDFFHEKTKHLDFLRSKFHEMMKFDQKNNEDYAKALSHAFKKID